MSATIAETARTEVLHTVEDAHQYDYDFLEPYVHPPETKKDLPWAELVTLDLQDYGRPGGKERLAKQLEHAVHHVGFFYVKKLWPYGRASSTTIHLGKDLLQPPNRGES
jgi:hypothetical protein